MLSSQCSATARSALGLSSRNANLPARARCTPSSLLRTITAPATTRAQIALSSGSEEESGIIDSHVRTSWHVPLRNPHHSNMQSKCDHSPAQLQILLEY